MTSTDSDFDRFPGASMATPVASSLRQTHRNFRSSRFAAAGPAIGRRKSIGAALNANSGTTTADDPSWESQWPKFHRSGSSDDDQPRRAPPNPVGVGVGDRHGSAKRQFLRPNRWFWSRRATLNAAAGASPQGCGRGHRDGAGVEIRAACHPTGVRVACSDLGLIRRDAPGHIGRDEVGRPRLPISAF